MASDLECLNPVLPSPSSVDEIISRFKPDVVLTVAHGFLYRAALRTATRAGLPLVTLFQDWWPDSIPVSRLLRRSVERRFRQLCAASKVAICVSEGMLAELGSRPNCVVLHDSPSVICSPQLKARDDGRFRIIYFGNLQEYGPMVEEAAKACLETPNLRLHIFGPQPWWSPGTEGTFRTAGIYHGLVSQQRIHAEAATFDVGLVTMSFDVRLKRRMQTSFPSKLQEMAALHLPLVVWGPNYCSAIRWARSGTRALCVTDRNPAALIAAIRRLARSPSDLTRLQRASRTAAETDFNPEQIRSRFVRLLENARSAGKRDFDNDPTLLG